MNDRLTHLDDSGRARMVDVSAKPASVREAIAEGRVRMAHAAFALARTGAAPKGDVRAVAEIAGVMAAKRTSELIPLCHPLPLSRIVVDVAPDEATSSFVVTAAAKTTGPTGVEMEALTAVSVACLAIYDMLKAADRAMTIEGVRLVSKSGGASGDYQRSAP
ncbi:MAG TPA: cyclic pyranopterin monophosphate synthase MoaC [Caulobacterales bacterium]|nr:cyclic pyranopterin monophosphate synthase MoaC [Caulobacterales bacterium]